MALIRGKEVQEGPKEYPQNEKLWNMLVAQAKARFRVYPSPAAAHWVHAHYAQLGGKFVSKEGDKDPRFIDWADRNIKKKEAEDRAKITKPVGKNLIIGERFRG